MEKIIAVVVMVAIVMGLIGAVVIPMSQEMEKTGLESQGQMGTLSGITMDEVINQYASYMKDMENNMVQFTVNTSAVGGEEHIFGGNAGSNTGDAPMAVGALRNLLIGENADKYTFADPEITYSDVTGKVLTITYVLQY